MRCLDRMILGNDGCRRLFTDPRYARDIIRSISHQSLDIDKLRRCHQITLCHIGCIIILNLRTRLFGLWNTDLGMVCCQLQKIPVAGDDRDFHALIFSKARHSTQKVVRFQSLFGDHRDPHCGKHLLHHRNLLTQFICHRLSRALVFCKHLVTKSRCMLIKGYGQIGRLFRVHDLEHDI